MIQHEWRGADGTMGLGYWTHEPDGSLPLAQLDRPFPWAISGRATSIHTYIIHTYTSSQWQELAENKVNIRTKKKLWEQCLPFYSFSSGRLCRQWRVSVPPWTSDYPFWIRIPPSPPRRGVWVSSTLVVVGGRQQLQMDLFSSFVWSQLRIIDCGSGASASLSRTIHSLILGEKFLHIVFGGAFLKRNKLMQ